MSRVQDQQSSVRLLCTFGALKGLRDLGVALALVGLLAMSLALPVSAHAEVGEQCGSEAFGLCRFSNSFVNEGAEPWTHEGGSAFTEAGGHPFAMNTEIVFNHRVLEEGEPAGPGEKLPTAVEVYGDAKTVVTNLPPGVIGDGDATPQRCTEEELEAYAFEEQCPRSAAVGVITAYLTGFPFRVIAPLYNMVAPRGIAVQLGANPVALGFVFHINGKLDPADNYGVSAEVANIQHGYHIYRIQATVWGDPAAPAHNYERGKCAGEVPYEKEASGIVCGVERGVERAETPFLTMPGTCSEEPLVSNLEVTSWPLPVTDEIAHPQTPPFSASPVTCSRALPFAPKLELRPEASTPSSPTGMSVDLHIPQTESFKEPTVADVKDLTVTLPQGMTLNPSAANGLEACSSHEIGLLSAPGVIPAKFENEVFNPATGKLQVTTCPEASKIGTIEVSTPLLNHTLPGVVYLAEQEANPFGSLFAIYVVVDDPISGVIVKLAGEIELNQETGQVRTRFSETPQLPYEEVKLVLPGGARAPLITPAGCGEQEATGALTPWDGGPTEVIKSSPAFEIEGCAPLGFSPAFAAGTVSDQAGEYGTLTMTLSRTDSEQEFKNLEVTFPPGLTAKLAGVPQCPGADAETGTCPEDSKIGDVVAAAGVGPDPVYVHGTVYLTGPYNNGPLGVAVEVPAIAGPFNLDENGRPVVVRGAIHINPTTAQVTVVTDPFPEKLRGVILHQRLVNVLIDRNEFELNPTNCAEQRDIAGTVTSTTGTSASISSPFEAANCASLPFAPKLTATAAGQGSKANGTAFAVTVESPGLHQANIQKVDLTIPGKLPSRLSTIQKACVEAVFNANPASCDEGSVIGEGIVYTPLFKDPIRGPAYLVSHGGAEFPDVEFVLQGEGEAKGVEVILDGKTDIKKGVTYSRFESTPDAPFTKFESIFPAGPHSALASNVPERKHYDLCGESLQMPTILIGQNGAQIEQTTKIAITGCPAHKKSRKRRHKKAHAKQTRTHSSHRSSR
jgi:hypothetical protein